MELQKLLKRKHKAITEKNESLICAACGDLADFYKNQENYHEAIEEYAILAKIYKKQKKMIEFATVNRGMGEVYMMLNEYDKAIEYQRIYLELSREHGNKLEEQRALATLGHTHLTKYLSENKDTKDLKVAEKYCLKSLEVCERLTDIKKFELVDMTARLYNNLGLIKQYYGHHNESISLFNKAIILCKANDVYEALYKAYISLASLLEKQGDFNGALQNYNFAQDTAKKFKNKTSELCDCLSSKALILLKLGDIQAAKKCYHKAYKLKLPETSKVEILRKLKSVIILYRTEKEMVSNCANNELQEYYEKIGDGFSALGCFDKAIEYYEKMLSEAEKNGKNLSSCYYSLAATHRDNEDYTKAVEYFEKEYSLCDFKKGLDTLCEIADTKETANCSSNDILRVYQRAIKSCREAQNKREEGRMLGRLINYLKRTNNLENITKYEEEFVKTGFVPTDSEPESAESSNEDDNLLNDITDDSDDSTSDSPKRKRQSFQVRRNLRGETQLHTACISGKLNVVKHLLEQGHPVNIRDNGGWLPLHDACISGHYEIVEFLLDKGAAINDRGGTHCNGTTPLHDAAVNAHLDIVELLLDRGASPLAKTGDGETPFHYLRKAALDVNLNDEQKAKYENLLERMSTVLDKAGQSTQVNTRIQSSAFIVEREQNFREPCFRIRRGIGDLSPERRNSDDSDNETIPKKKSVTPKKSEATNEYKKVMQNLRRKTQELSSPEVKTSTKRSAFLMEDEVADDEWLEDDLIRTNKKRRINLTNDLINATNSKSSSQSMRRTNSSDSVKNKTKSPRKSNEFPDSSGMSNEFLEIFENSDDEFMAVEDNVSFPRNSLKKDKNRVFPRKSIQPKITHFANTSPIKISIVKQKKSPLKRHQSIIIDDDPMLAMDVDIEGRSFRVTTKMSMKNTLTIKWLALEAARRYAKKEYVEPILELVTKSGAELVDDDLIGTLFVTDSQVVEVKARVLKWNLPHISKRYQDACTDMGTSPVEAICQRLDTITISLDVANNFYESKSLVPLCKALLRENRLVELDFSNNFLSQYCVQLLATALPTLENLTKLNLRCTNLHASQISLISNSLENNAGTVLNKLRVLDLSENFITDENFENLCVITSNLNLKELNLAMLNFSDEIFEKSINRNVNLSLKGLERLNLSGNNFRNDILLRILTGLNVNQLKSLDISSNHVTTGFLRNFLNECTQRFNLDYLNLSRCSIEDSEVFNLLRSSDRLDTLNLSYTEITSLSLRRLLENQGVNNLNLIGCRNIDNYDNYANEWNLNGESLKKLKITCDPQKFDILIKLWQDKYGKISVIKKDYLLILQ